MALIHAENNEPVQGRTRLQKMVFLLQQRTPDWKIPEYQFEAYDYGPFSKSLYDDLDNLIERNLVEENREEFDQDKILYEYNLTEKGKKAVRLITDEQEWEELILRADEIKSQFNRMELAEVLDFVYTEYPQFAENSVLR